MATIKNWSTTFTSAAGAIYGAVQYTEKKHLTLVDVMGLTGHAFRMNIDPQEVNAAGPTSFPGGYILRRNLCNLGFTSCLADATPPVPPEKVERTIALIQESIDRGVPAISFDLFAPEFGLIYGYDDDQQLFYAKEMSQDASIPYTKFASPRIDVLFVTTISESLPHSKYEMLRMALDMIVEHARGREWTHVFKDRFAQGLAGYDAWIGVMERRAADEQGNAFNVEVVSDARDFAAQYLRDLARTWSGSNVVERKVRTFAEEAAEYYAIVATNFAEMLKLFPFPHGGNPKDPESADQAIQLLKQAKEAEEKGVAVLEKMLNFMKAYHSETWVH